jgi:hypothetical protein
MTLAPAFFRAEAAYLTPPDLDVVDGPVVAVAAGCAALMDPLERMMLEEDPCEPTDCAFCEQPVCQAHSSGDAELVNSCDGSAHDTCHRQACTDRDCWYDG